MASLQNEWNRGVGYGKNAHLNSVCTLQFYISTPPALFYYALVKGSLIQIIAICLWFSCTFAFWGTLFRNPQNNLYVDFNERHLFAWYSAPILTIENSWEKSPPNQPSIAAFFFGDCRQWKRRDIAVYFLVLYSKYFLSFYVCT